MADEKDRADALAKTYMSYVERFQEVLPSLPSPHIDSRFDRLNRTGVVITDRTDIYTADIDTAVERFLTTMEIGWRNFNGQLPVIVTRSSSDIPVDLSELSGLRDPVFGLDLDDFIFGWGRPERRSKVVLMRAKHVVAAFRRHLEDFLISRFRARESDISEKPGRLFEVRTDTEGLRVHYSNAFLLDRRNVFGSPTSPVKAWIQPGNYYFGATGRGLPLWFDLDSKYDVMAVPYAKLDV